MARKGEVQHLLVMHDSLLFDLSTLIFLNTSSDKSKPLATEVQIIAQNLALCLIHSAHLFAFDSGSSGTHVTLLSPKTTPSKRKESLDYEVRILHSSSRD